MATWSDKRLQGHKRAQSYLSSGTATLGIAALGAASAKSPFARKAAKKVGGAAMRRGASVKMGNRIAGAPDRMSRSATGLTTLSAGVGGVGGYNFAAIQSQEAKKARALRPTKRKPVMKSDNPFDISKGDRAKDFWVGAKVKPERKKAAIKTNLREQTKGVVTHTAGGAAIGAATLGGTAAVLNAKTHGAAWKAAKTARGARKAIGGGKGRRSGEGVRYALRSAKSSLTSRNTVGAAAAGAYGGANTGLYTGTMAGVDAGHRKNRAAGNYKDRVKKSLSSDVANSPFLISKAGPPQPQAPQPQSPQAGQTQGKTQPSMRPVRSMKTAPMAPKPGQQPVTKAYDPERKRMRRLEGYNVAANVGAGALGAAGGLKLFQAGKQAKGLARTANTTTGKNVVEGAKAVARTGGKGLALAAGGAGSLYAGKKIKQHSRKGGRPYKQLPLK